MAIVQGATADTASMGTPGEASPGSQPGTVTNPTAPADTATLADMYQSYLNGLQTGTTGNGEAFMDGSLQPVAPQAPGGALLTGKFGSAMQNKTLWIVGGIIIVALIWYFYRKRNRAA